MKSKIYAVYFVLILASASTSIAQNIVRDSSFNLIGSSLQAFYGNIDRGFDCAVQTDQKILIVGLSKNTATNFFELCIARYTTNGTLDTTFSNDGKAFVSMGNQSSIGGQTPKIKIDANEKIVLVGTGRGSNSQDFLIARLNSNGTPDLSFNGIGYIFIDILGSNTQPDAANAFNFDTLGNIYVTGVVGISPPVDNQLAVVKLTNAGALDNSFDLDGKQYYNLGSGNEFGRGIAELPNGNIVVGLNASSTMALLCINPAGAPVAAFGTSGYTTISFSASSTLTDLELDNSGRIVVCGTVLGSLNDDIAIARYLSSGLPDATFSSAGKFESDIFGGDDKLNALFITDDNKILVAGSATNLDFDFLVAKIDTNGAFDLTFNNNSGYYKTTSNFSGIDETFNGIALLNNGSIFVTGTIIISSAVTERAFSMLLKNSGPLAVEQIGASAQPTIFPNPFSSEVTIECEKNAIYLIKDVSGKTILSLNLKQGINILELNELPKGVYFVSDLTTGNTSKLIKTN